MGPRVNTPLRPVLGHDGSLPQGDAKHDAVEGMFDRLAPRYDRMNRIISLGLDKGWRRRTVDALAAPELADRLARTGFRDVRHTTLTGGSVLLLTGTRA